jgi:CRP/FNR family transcriptional regulator, cyclic AMP receptor protein
MEPPVPSIDILRSVPLFSGMRDRSLEIVADLARPVRFEAGAVLTRQGDPGDRFIVITEGSATVSRDGAGIRTLGPGDFFGEISLIDGGPRTATVTAATALEGLEVDRHGFERLMADFPVVRLDLVTALTHRLRQRSAEPTD